MGERLEINEYLMLIAWAASKRSTCPRKACGAVVSERGIVIATGFNGAPSGMPHCTEVGCLMHHVSERARCRRIIHGEVNAIRHAGGRGDTLHTTGEPCWNCTLEIVATRTIKRVFWLEPYPDQTRDEQFAECGKVVADGSILFGGVNFYNMVGGLSIVKEDG